MAAVFFEKKDRGMATVMLFIGGRGQSPQGKVGVAETLVRILIWSLSNS